MGEDAGKIPHTTERIVTSSYSHPHVADEEDLVLATSFATTSRGQHPESHYDKIQNWASLARCARESTVTPPTSYGSNTLASRYLST